VGLGSPDPLDILRGLWRRLKDLPGGRRVASRLLGRLVPYSGSTRPEILEARPGRARVAMADRRAVRNHLGSIHAVALVNLAELTSGLAMLMGLPDDARGIVTSLSIDYLKKARGRLVSECDCEPPRDNRKQAMTLHAEIRDASGDVVARATVHWLVGPAA